jgi:hypothetical protein
MRARPGLRSIGGVAVAVAARPEIVKRLRNKPSVRSFARRRTEKLTRGRMWKLEKTICVL